MFFKVVFRGLLTVGSILFISSLAPAQGRWTWPEKPQNIKVMPGNWTGDSLRPVMMGFTGALGVRCSYCHVGEEGKPLSTYDFPSDANPNKARAREMWKMLGDIDGHLEKIEPSGERVDVSCSTCHRGRPKPTTLVEEMDEAYRMGGIESAVTRYKSLRADYYGRGSLDFGVNTLNRFGYELMEKNDLTGALKILTMNTEIFPESSNAWDGLAEAYMKSGDKETAKKYYQKSLELDPGNRRAARMLQELGGN